MAFVIKFILVSLYLSLFLFIDLPVVIFIHSTQFEFTLYTATHLPDKGGFILRGGEGIGAATLICHVSSGKEKRHPGNEALVFGVVF